MAERGRGASTATRTRRRFARRQWRRRWLAWRYVGATVLLMVLVGFGIYAIRFSSWLDVETVEVRGAETLQSDAVRARTGIETGTPLIVVDLDVARARVASIAAVAEVEVTRRWPDTVVVQIEERVPIAVVDLGGRLRGMDARGVVFRDYRTAPPGLPRVRTEIGTSAASLREAADVISALPADLLLVVDYVLVVTADEISLFLTDGREVVWGSAEDSATKARVLAELLRSVEAEVYDVSVPSKPATRP